MEEGGEGGKTKGGRGKQTEGRGGQEGATPSPEWQKKHARRDKSDTETEAGGEAGTSQSQCKKGHMTNIYLIDLDEQTIVDFMKDHEKLYNKAIEHFKDKAKMECLWERLANSRNLSVIVCKTWCESQRRHYGKLML